jgi:diguanylate cyclase (GGDEF)-like protein
MPLDSLRRFSLRTLLLSTAAIAALLLVVVLVPQVLSRHARLDVLRNHVGEVARLAASQVDGDLHRALIDGSQADNATRERALEPLLRLHRAWPEAVYLYTMGMRDGSVFFVLDTAQDAAFAASRRLRASSYLEPFHLRAEYASNWLDELAAGRTYVNADFQHDDYGYFLSGHAPIRDSMGRVAGFAGVDFDLEYYRAEEVRFQRIEAASVLLTLALSLLLGYLYARYRHSHSVEVRLHYESSMQDFLTGLPNRRGALAAIDEAWSKTDAETQAALLVDIDNFKSINDTHGHATGDAVILALAGALRSSLRPGDLAARLGGDEFLIFADGCDLASAESIAGRLLAIVRHGTGSPVPFNVSIGISVITGTHADFDPLYRQADSALYAAKRAGRDRYAVFGND